MCSPSHTRISRSKAFQDLMCRHHEPFCRCRGRHFGGIKRASIQVMGYRCEDLKIFVTGDVLKLVAMYGMGASYCLPAPCHLQGRTLLGMEGHLPSFLPDGKFVEILL